MSMLSERAAAGKECSISAIRGESILTITGTIKGVTDTILSIEVDDADKLKKFEGIEKVILNSEDVDGRAYSATDNGLLFSKKQPNVVGISSVLKVAYANNRVYPRYPYSAHAAVKYPYDQDWHKCICLDASLGGVALDSDWQIPVGSIIDILLYDKFIKTSIMLKAEVRHTHRQAAGSFLVGCQCESTEELKTLVGNLAEESFNIAV